MNAPIPTNHNTYLSRAFQLGFLAVTPAAIAKFGGPIVLWNEHGFLVRAILIGTLTPSVICGAGACEDTIRAVHEFAKAYMNSRDFNQAAKSNGFQCEIKRAAGFGRAALFPINGWAVVVNLPVYDHYVYSVPVESVIKIAKVADFAMENLGGYTVLKGVLENVIIPIGKVCGTVLGACFSAISRVLR